MQSNRTEAAEQAAQLVLGGLESGPLRRGELLTRPVQVEREHRHGGTERIRLAAIALLGRTLERAGDLPRIFEGEHPGLEIERIARLGHSLGPALALRGHHADVDRGAESEAGFSAR